MLPSLLYILCYHILYSCNLAFEPKTEMKLGFGGYKFDSCRKFCTEALAV